MKTLGSEGFYWSICPTPSIYSLGWLLTLEKQCSDPSPWPCPTKYIRTSLCVAEPPGSSQRLHQCCWLQTQPSKPWKHAF